MVGSEFFDYVKKFQLTTYVGVEDFADKFNFNYTTLVLIMCTLIISVKQYVMKPIACYIPNMPSGSDFDDYLENYCWIHGTIPLLSHQTTPMDEDWDELDKTQRINYYQWVPFVLGLQCVMFYIPRIIWQTFCYNRTGTDLENIIHQSCSAVQEYGDKRDKKIAHIVSTLDDMFYKHRDDRRGKMAKVRRTFYKYCSFMMVSKRLGTWLVFGYLFIKFLYLINAIGQIYLIRSFLGFQSNMTFFGYELLREMTDGRDWRQTLFFPRVTHCNANNVRQVGAKIRFIAQCALPVNMLNEKVYIFLWFWINLCSFLTIISVPIWLFRIVFVRNRLRFVHKLLRVAERQAKRPKPKKPEVDTMPNNKMDSTMSSSVNRARDYDITLEPQVVELFVDGYLRHDGVFLLRMIALNAGDLICTEIIFQLWDVYCRKYKGKDMRNFDNVSGIFFKAQKKYEAQRGKLHENPDSACVQLVEPEPIKRRKGHHQPISV